MPAADIQDQRGGETMNQNFRDRGANIGKSVLCFALFMAFVVIPWVVGMARIVVRIFGD